ncbi:hypothetical protein R69746_05905 [Paraburkholderia aspalathi]|nr:hypothetical protein R69746_05905 [Paraburkholderia aspalathi]
MPGLFACECPRIVRPTYGGTGSCRFHGHARSILSFAVDVPGHVVTLFTRFDAVCFEAS